jgi:hypothetical protein
MPFGEESQWNRPRRPGYAIEEMTLVTLGGSADGYDTVTVVGTTGRER